MVSSFCDRCWPYSTFDGDQQPISFCSVAVLILRVFIMLSMCLDACTSSSLVVNACRSANFLLRLPKPIAISIAGKLCSTSWANILIAWQFDFRPRCDMWWTGLVSLIRTNGFVWAVFFCFWLLIAFIKLNCTNIFTFSRFHAIF